MNVNEKIKRIDNKIEQNKAKYNLHRETAMISALSLLLLEKVAAIQRFEYSPLIGELKKQTHII